MAKWSEVCAAAGDLAAAVLGRFEAHGLGLMATIRRDGSPRLSGVEPLFVGGELSFVRPGGDRFAIEWWRSGGPVRRVERR